jgi:uncharacterized protein YjeT (DUF2065 family)
VNPFAGVEICAAVLLVLAGLPKAFRPEDTRRALRSVGWRVPDAAVRLGGGLEATLGVAAAVLGGVVLTSSVAASYLGFSVFVVIALRRGGSLASCGCIGTPDTPPTKTHVVVTGLLAAGSLAAIGGSADGIRGLADATIGPAVAVGVGTLVLTWLVWLALAELPRLKPPTAA